MKSKVLMLAIAFVSSLSLLAQEAETIDSNEKEDRPMNTLLKGGKEKAFGGHLSMNMKGTEVYNEAALLLGGELVFTLGHTLNIGLAGYGLVSNINYEEYDDYPYFQTEPLSLEMGYGGFFIEPVFFDQSVVHFSVPVLVGGGWAGISRNHEFGNGPGFDYDYYVLEDTDFFVFEPGINMEVNLTRYVKFTVGGTYRMVAGSDLAEVSDNDLSGFSISGGLRIGWF